jgi:hypothetical protein
VISFTHEVCNLLAEMFSHSEVLQLAHVTQRGLPASEPFLSAVYAPLVYVASDPAAPGHSLFMAYLEWTQELFIQTFR